MDVAAYYSQGSHRETLANYATINRWSFFSSLKPRGTYNLFGKTRQSLCSSTLVANYATIKYARDRSFDKTAIMSHSVDPVSCASSRRS